MTAITNLLLSQGSADYFNLLRLNVKENVITNHNKQKHTCGYAREFKRLSEPDEQYRFSKLVI